MNIKFKKRIKCYNFVRRAQDACQLFGEMVTVGLDEVTYGPQQTLSYTFLIENGRSGTFCLQLVANLPRKGGLEYGLTFCRLPEIWRDLPVVVGYS
jgi:hypothetical protein